MRRHAPGGRTAQHDGEDQRRQHQAAVGFPAAQSASEWLQGVPSLSLRPGARTSSSSGTARFCAAARPPAWRTWRRGRAAAEGPCRPPGAWRRGGGSDYPGAARDGCRPSGGHGGVRHAVARALSGERAARHSTAWLEGAARGSKLRAAATGAGSARQRGGRVARGAAERVPARAGAAATAAAPRAHSFVAHRQQGGRLNAQRAAAHAWGQPRRAARERKRARCDVLSWRRRRVVRVVVRRPCIISCCALAALSVAAWMSLFM